MSEKTLASILQSNDKTKEAKYVVYGGKLLPDGVALLERAIYYLQVHGWTPMAKKHPSGARDIIGALEAADGDQYPTTSPAFRTVVAAICRHLDYDAIHMWEYNLGSYRTQDDALNLLLEIRRSQIEETSNSRSA